MPIYEYECQECGARFEKMISRAKADEVLCANCNSDKTERQFSTFGVSSAKPAANPCAQGACEIGDRSGACPMCPEL